MSDRLGALGAPRIAGSTGRHIAKANLAGCLGHEIESIIDRAVDAQYPSTQDREGHQALIRRVGPDDDRAGNAGPAGVGGGSEGRAPGRGHDD